MKYGDAVKFEDWNPRTGRIYHTRGVVVGTTPRGTVMVNTPGGVRFIPQARIVAN